MSNAKNILIIGDSLVYGYGVPIGSEWVQLLSNKVSSKHFINLGQNGDITSNIKHRLYAQLQIRNFKTVFIEGGINDFLLGISVEVVRDNLLSMVHMAIKEGVEAHLILPHKPALEKEDPFYQALQYNSLVNKVDQLSQLDYGRILNLDPLFQQDPSYFIDGIHPTEVGHEYIAKAVYSYGKRNSIW